MSGFEITLAALAVAFYGLGAVVSVWALSVDMFGRKSSEPPAWFIGLLWPVAALYLVWVMLGGDD